MRRRLALAGAVGSVVAVLAVGAFASGLFSYEKPDRDSALPDDTRTSAPDLVDPAPTSRGTSGSASASASDSGSAAPSPDRSTSPSASSSGSTSATAPSARSAAGTAAAPSPFATPATGTVSSTPEERGTGSQVLRRGDEGPEVVELQQRLQQLRLYTGEADGVYDRSVEDAVSRYQRARGIRENGTYGPQTRRSLESETTEP
ncbi:spore cortex-lytic enzyme precursor [Streptomyces jeddahensis]|uniref:Spore cortex-lytic enzyme n=1 Tax=Streptomyces jeddahensis TaxID=1716141 RepID=A0A177HZX6_9ACTN|nr:spore cortex-lytic enzyme precursor [Streptomyces jeddahensis]